jgi:hypothetical protein
MNVALIRSHNTGSIVSGSTGTAAAKALNTAPPHVNSQVRDTASISSPTVDAFAKFHNSIKGALDGTSGSKEKNSPKFHHKNHGKITIGIGNPHP